MAPAAHVPRAIVLSSGGAHLRMLSLFKTTVQSCMLPVKEFSTTLCIVEDGTDSCGGLCSWAKPATPRSYGLCPYV